MRFNEIGQQLRAYRLESGLRAEEIAARLGVSRAALYRYEKGDVIKLDTIQRLAELLKISPLSLLGIGFEYYTRATAFFERTRQLEETADQVLQLDGPLCYQVTSDRYDATLAEVFEEAAARSGAERVATQAASEQLRGLLHARKRLYAARRPSIIAIIPAVRLQHFLAAGVGGGHVVSEATRARARDVAAAEAEHIATIMEAEPMGLQLGILPNADPAGSFVLYRTRDRATLMVNPFVPDAPSGGGVAMVTGAEEAIATHQRVAEAQWREAVKGPAAARLVRGLLRGTTTAPKLAEVGSD
ncbi:MAG: helix-turn-helix transcriptional regulator [Acetobacteraceae bacterium]|nr:helix-turn-helix transcriptional regulator [Acetobacteraceae bacterium]